MEKSVDKKDCLSLFSTAFSPFPIFSPAVDLSTKDSHSKRQNYQLTVPHIQHIMPIVSPLSGVFDPFLTFSPQIHTPYDYDY